MIPMIVCVALLSPSQVPTAEALRDAARTNQAGIESFVLKAHAIETDNGEMPPEMEKSIAEGPATPFADFKKHAASRPALAREWEKRYHEAVAAGADNVKAVKARSKPGPIELVISANFGIPAVKKEVRDKRDLVGTARSLGLDEAGPARLDKSYVETITSDAMVRHSAKYGTKLKLYFGGGLNDLFRIDSQRMIWLGLVPAGFADCDELSISEDKPGGHIRIRATTGVIRKEYVVDPAIGFRVLRYTATQVPTDQVLAEYTAADYRPVRDNVLVPFKTTLKQMKYGVPNSYSLVCTIDSFTINPKLDASVFSPPKGVQIEAFDSSGRREEPPKTRKHAE